MTTKICIKCGIEKPTTKFFKKSSAKDGFQGSCKQCFKKYYLDWLAKNYENVSAKKAAYYLSNKDKIKARAAANPEKIKAQRAAYRIKNREKRNAETRAWRAANPEKIKAQRISYKEANPQYRASYRANHLEQHRIHEQNRRARKREVGGELSAGLTKKLFTLQRGKCACCKQPLGKDYHLDHIMPLALGGTNTDDNMQLLRASCNLQKNKKHPIEYMQSKGLLL